MGKNPDNIIYLGHRNMGFRGPFLQTIFYIHVKANKASHPLLSTVI